MTVDMLRGCCKEEEGGNYYIVVREMGEVSVLQIKYYANRYALPKPSNEVNRRVLIGCNYCLPGFVIQSGRRISSLFPSEDEIQRCGDCPFRVSSGQ